MNLYNLPFLLKLSENDKRLIWLFVMVIVALLSLLIIVALIIEKIGKSQAKKIDVLMHDLVVAGLVDSKKKFIKLSMKKNNIFFYKHARISILIILVHFIASIIFISCFEGATYGGLFTDYSSYGFATLFPVYDLSTPVMTNFFGWFEILTGFGEPLNTPHFTVEGIFAYIFVPTLLIGIMMFLYQVEGHIARTIRIHSLAKKIYSKNLDNVHYNPLANVQLIDNTITIVDTKEQQKNEEPKVTK